MNGTLFHDVFQTVRQYLPNGELVDLHDNYDNCKCFLSEDGLQGFAIEEDGNLISVFSLNSAELQEKKGFLYAIKDFIREQGATHLDAYASPQQNLEEIYKKTLGFQVASTMDYNMECMNLLKKIWNFLVVEIGYFSNKCSIHIIEKLLHLRVDLEELGLMNHQELNRKEKKEHIPNKLHIKKRTKSIQKKVKNIFILYLIITFADRLILTLETERSSNALTSHKENNQKHI